MPGGVPVGTALHPLWNVFVAEECGAWAQVLGLQGEEEAPRAFRSHCPFIENMDESEEEDEEEDNDGDGDEGGENEEEEEEDAEAGSEKEEEARLTALEEQRLEGKVLGSCWEVPHWPSLVPAPAQNGKNQGTSGGGGPSIHKCLPCVPRNPE